MGLRFGTDGVRGVANSELTPAAVLDLGRAAAQVLGRGRWLIGRDTRVSGPMFEAALAAGLAAEGADVTLLGVAPTPAIACLAAGDGICAAAITASHNPFGDNGVKLFAAGGAKLDDATEAAIADRWGRLADPALSGADVGSVSSAPQRVSEYTARLRAVLRPGALAGMRVVLDCANGAMSEVAPQVAWALGASAVVINAEPDGTNINDACGATAPEALSKAVVEQRAHLGLAFDGDGDRVIAVDDRGRVVDGDRLLALSAIELRDEGRLAHDTVVVTVMSNLGFHRAMERHGIAVHVTPVGDRYVLQALDDGGFSLGGEQSGHIIHRGLATTGDGLLAGLILADTVRRSGRSLAQLADEVMVSYPQVLHNVRLPSLAADVDVAAVLTDEIAAAEKQLGREGRVLVRASGTEPVVRVMVEAATAEDARRTAEGLVAAVTERLG